MKTAATHHDYLKYMFGGSTLKELIDQLRALADHYEKLHKQGAELTSEIDAGRVFYTIPGHDVEMEEDEDGEVFDDQDDMCPICYKVDNAG